MKIPSGYQQLMPYLIVSDAAKFMSFLKTVFGAKEKSIMSGDDPVIRHAEMTIGECTIMLADSIEGYPPRPGGFFVYVENADETYRLALENGASSLQAPTDKEYGRACGVLDPFGNSWWPTSVQ